jgi:hypothetical protein
MIGKHDPGINGEGPRGTNTLHRVAKEVDAVGEQSVTTPFLQVTGEKIAAAGDAVTAEIRHRTAPVSSDTVLDRLHSSEYAFGYSDLPHFD